MIAPLSSLFLSVALANPIQEVPELTGVIVDIADLISADAEAEIAAELVAHERRTSHQIVVLTLPSLDGRSVEDRAIEIARAWALGLADQDNGVLVLIAAEERKSRIEVGTGLEGLLTDMQAGIVLREVMRPSLAIDDYDTGVRDGLAAIYQVLDGEPLVSSVADTSIQSFEEIPWWARTLMALFVSLFLFGISFAALATGGGVQIALFLIFGNPLAAALGFIAGAPLYLWAGYAALFLLLAVALSFLPAGRAWRRRVGKSMASGSSGSSSGYSSYSSGSSSSSDYSGGGGDFAGGGASDDY